MSDIEKVYARAKMLGSGTPIQLRWEGAGDAIHAAELLKALQSKMYDDGITPIKYHATINLYEAEDSEIFDRASKNMAAAQLTASDTQTISMKGNADVTRNPQIFGQNQAHVMFIRNIMLTDSDGNSLTKKKFPLLGLHEKAIRRRADSLVMDSGQIRLGMSGAPGLNSDISVKNRDTTSVKHLFFHSNKLFKAAEKADLTLEGGPNRQGGTDTDVSEVMKNDGTSLGQKPTYYLVFQK
jgi:hypothetical protein